MNQSELNLAVARITGDSIQTIKRLGFLLEERSGEDDFINDDYETQVIDWDELELEREWQNQFSSNSELSYM